MNGVYEQQNVYEIESIILGNDNIDHVQVPWNIKNLEKGETCRKN